jgi:phospholipase C
MRAVIAAGAGIAIAAAGPLCAVAAANNQGQPPTATPIKHAIVVIGENRSFDHVFATYRPKNGETVLNLLSEGVIDPDGRDPGIGSMRPGNTRFRRSPAISSARAKMPRRPTQGCLTRP